MRPGCVRGFSQHTSATVAPITIALIGTLLSKDSPARTALKNMIKHDRIKIQFVCPEQKISKQALSGYKEVRLVTSIPGQGVRVDYFDGSIEWFAVNALVYVLK